MRLADMEKERQKTALKWGAKYGQGFGCQGRTFAIPTMNKNIHKLKIEKVEYWIDKFIDVARWEFQDIFLVTEIGCGLAGFKIKEIAPLFESCIELRNVYLPKSFWRILTKEK
jgi:hypothetical protein